MNLSHACVRPRTDIVSFIEWDPRELNTLADSAANQALDTGSDWSFTHQTELARALTDGRTFRVCFDGAMRKHGDAAAGLAVMAYYDNGDRDLLLRAGKKLGKLNSAFLAETLACEWALDTFFSVIVKSL